MDKEAWLAIGGVVILLAIIGLGAMWIDKTSCLSSYENYQPQWGIFSGCRIMSDGKATPVDIIRELKSPLGASTGSANYLQPAATASQIQPAVGN